VKDKYGSDYEEGDGDDDEEDSEELESEDEDGDELTPAMDAAILRTLARIKRKDPAIYDAEKGVFDGMFSAPVCCSELISQTMVQRRELHCRTPSQLVNASRRIKCVPSSINPPHNSVTFANNSVSSRPRA
jgi:hypothetical protein